jgi:hypothetical protein
MTTQPQGRTRRSPDGAFAGTGAVRQHGSALPIYICNQCGNEVVWAESKRTGRKYLVNISHAYNGARFYIGSNVHQCSPRWTNPLGLNDYYADLIFDAEDGAVEGLSKSNDDYLYWKVVRS